MTMVITKVVGASGVTVVPGVPYPQMTESQQSWFLILKEFLRDAAPTSSSVEKMANVYLRDGFVTIIKTVKMEKMNTIIALLLTVSPGNFRVANTSSMQPTASHPITDVTESLIVRTEVTSPIVTTDKNTTEIMNVNLWLGMRIPRAFGSHGRMSVMDTLTVEIAVTRKIQVVINQKYLASCQSSSARMARNVFRNIRSAITEMNVKINPMKKIAIFLPATADSSGVRTVSASPPGGGATDTRTALMEQTSLTALLSVVLMTSSTVPRVAKVTLQSV